VLRCGGSDGQSKYWRKSASPPDTDVTSASFLFFFVGFAPLREVQVGGISISPPSCLSLPLCVDGLCCPFFAVSSVTKSSLEADDVRASMDPYCELFTTLSFVDARVFCGK
jgi:hypothetical protein